MAVLLDAVSQVRGARFASPVDDVGQVSLEGEPGRGQERQQRQGERQWGSDSEITDVKSFPLSDSTVRESRWWKGRRRPYPGLVPGAT